MDMKLAVASDHRGIDVKRNVLELLEELGVEVTDFGPDSTESVDYPDFAGKVAQGVSGGAADRGILVCGTGLGMSIAANKFPNVQATPCHDELTAKMSRLHNNSNILCVSADLLGDNLISQMVRTWLSTEFEGGRHARRLEKIRSLETGHCPEVSP